MADRLEDLEARVRSGCPKVGPAHCVSVAEVLELCNQLRQARAAATDLASGLRAVADTLPTGDIRDEALATLCSNFRFAAGASGLSEGSDT